MTPPRLLIRVEWSIARSYDRPDDRTEQGRNFQSASSAARQIRSIRGWEPTHAELLLVARTAGWSDGELRWESIDPDEVLGALAPHEEARYTAQELARSGAELDRISAALAAGDTDREGIE